MSSQRWCPEKVTPSNFPRVARCHPRIKAMATHNRCPNNSNSSSQPKGFNDPITVDRRNALVLLSGSLPAALFLAPSPGLCFDTAVPPVDAEMPSLVLFTRDSQGYTLQRPSGWEQVDKAGADALFRDPNQKSATLGVTVLPVMISSLQHFGSLDAVGEKLLGAEKAKESTLSAVIVESAQRSSQPGDVAIYDFVYELNSTRGRKLVANTVTVVNKKLYIVNGTLPCAKDSCDGNGARAELVKRATQSLQVALV